MLEFNLCLLIPSGIISSQASTTPTDAASPAKLSQQKRIGQKISKERLAKSSKESSKIRTADFTVSSLTKKGNLTKIRTADFTVSSLTKKGNLTALCGC